MRKYPPARPVVEDFSLYDKDGVLHQYSKLHWQARLNSHETPSDAPLLEMIKYTTNTLNWSTRQLFENALGLLYEALANDKQAPKRFEVAHVTTEMLTLLQETRETQARIMKMLSEGQLVARDTTAQAELKAMGLEVMQGAGNLGGAVVESDHEDDNWD